MTSEDKKDKEQRQSGVNFVGNPFSNVRRLHGWADFEA